MRTNICTHPFFPWGAFTVANLNDTDGDGTPDNVDTNGVKATPAGRDEVDLMKLEIKGPPGGFTKPVTLKLEGGNAAFWRTPTKDPGTKVTLTDGQVTFPCDTVPPELWVEATSASSAVRDIVITAESDGVQDKVVATGVWATVISENNVYDIRHDRGQPVWANMPTPPFGPWALMTTDADTIDNPLAPPGDSSPGWGLRWPNTPPGPMVNSIGFRFLLLPEGISQVEGVHFDVARRREGYTRRVLNGETIFRDPFEFPSMLDAANDDRSEGDESMAQREGNQDFIYSVDTPGEPIPLGPPGLQSIMYANFEEFVRVGIGVDPANNSPIPIGSRASVKYNWHNVHTLKMNPIGTQWERIDATPVNPAETAANNIGTAHIAIP